MAQEPEMPLHTAVDLAMQYHRNMVKPFERMTQVLKIALTAEKRAREADEATGRAQQELATVRSAIDALRREQAEAEASARATITRVRTEERDETARAQAQKQALAVELNQAVAETAASIKALNERVDRRTREIEITLAEWEGKLRDARGKHEAFMKSLGVA